MIWLCLLLALGAFAIGFTTTSIPLAMFCLLAALVFLCIWIMGLLAQRVGARTRDDTMLIDPLELRRMREQAEARRATANPGSEPPAS